MGQANTWAERLHDQRSKRVIFLAHCLLNENTRYLGGAMAPGAVRSVVEPCLTKGIGIVQLPCPEQAVWGGVLKHRLLRLYGIGGVRERFAELLLPLLLLYTRIRYRRLAHNVVKQIADYISSGYEVVGIVGVDASPSCGVNRTLRIGDSLKGLARLTPTATSSDVNAIVREAAVAGRGIFVSALRRELRRRELSVPFAAHDLLAELEGEPSRPVEALLEKRGGE